MSTRTKLGVAALLALLILAGLYSIAHVHRYEVVGHVGEQDATVLLWDRWMHRTCISPPRRDVTC